MSWEDLLPTPSVKLGAIDLNLLIVFDAVMQERNVTRAGQRLGLSQPAMSHALTRLRYMLKDDLFIRSPKGMLQAPRAEQLALPVRSALERLQWTIIRPLCWSGNAALSHLAISSVPYATDFVDHPTAAASGSTGSEPGGTAGGADAGWRVSRSNAR